MKDLFTFLWTAAPEVVSLFGIVAMLVFISVKLTLFFNEFKQMGTRITNVERKVDMIIDFLMTGNPIQPGK